MSNSTLAQALESLHSCIALLYQHLEGLSVSPQQLTQLRQDVEELDTVREQLVNRLAQVMHNPIPSQSTLHQQAKATEPTECREYPPLNIKSRQRQDTIPTLSLGQDSTQGQSEARYRAIVEEQTELICRFLPDGTLTFVNEAYCRYFERSPAELLGSKFTPFISQPEHEAAQRHLASLSRDNSIGWFEHRVIRANGEIRWQQWCDRALFDDTGCLYEIQSVGRDITAQKQTEEQLQRSQLFIETIANTSPQLLYLYDLVNHRNLYVNRQIINILGYTPEEVKQAGSQFFLETVHPDDLEIILAESSRFAGLADGEVLESEFRMRHKNGSWRWLRTRDVVFTRDSNGVPQQILGTASDITSHKQAEMQIRESLKEKEVLLKEIHHRVKNNLQILSSLLRLQANRVENQTVRYLLHDSRSRVESMALVHELLYCSHNFSRIDFTDYANKLAAKLFSTYNIYSQRITFHARMQPNVFICLEQAIPCGLIINELISNALKHGFNNRRQGEVILTLEECHNRHLLLKVSNNGEPLPPTFNLHKSRTMGLQLIATLVEQLKGAIEVETGEITVFTIQFPLKL